MDYIFFALSWNWRPIFLESRSNIFYTCLCWVVGWFCTNLNKIEIYSSHIKRDWWPSWCVCVLFLYLLHDKSFKTFYVVPWSLRLKTFKRALLNYFTFWSKEWTANKSVAAQEVANKFPSTFSLFLSIAGKNRKHLMSFEIISILIRVFCVPA